MNIAVVQKLVRIFRIVTVGTLVVFLFALTNSYVNASDDAYGEGAFNGCSFSQCSITESSSGTVNIDVTPTASAKCTIASDTVGVLTDSTTGYTLVLNDSDSNNNIVGNNTSTNIPSVSATRTTAAALTANTWGYRIDDSGGALGTNFGTGSTSQSNVAPGSISNNKFAAPNTSSSDEIATSTSAANPTVNTSVWYGICADLSVPHDTYNDQVTYTATIN